MGLVVGATSLPVGLHFCRLAGAVWLEKISAPFLSHFENSQNLKVTLNVRHFHVCANAQIRNYPRRSTKDCSPIGTCLPRKPVRRWLSGKDVLPFVHRHVGFRRAV